MSIIQTVFRISRLFLTLFALTLMILYVPGLRDLRLLLWGPRFQQTHRRVQAYHSGSCSPLSWRFTDVSCHFRHFQLLSGSPRNERWCIEEGKETWRHLLPENASNPPASSGNSGVLKWVSDASLKARVTVSDIRHPAHVCLLQGLLILAPSGQSSFIILRAANSSEIPFPWPHNSVPGWT